MVHILRRHGSRGLALAVLCVLCVSVVNTFAAEQAGKSYALVIGINEYEHLGQLESCRQDAEAVAKVLVENAGFDPDRVCLIADGDRAKEFQPTYTNLLRRFEQFTDLPRPGDTLLIFFAGHGITIDKEAYLMPADGSDERTGFAITWLRERVAKCKAASKVLILDACHSGKATRGMTGIAPSLVAGAATLVLTSCNEKQVSYPEDGHGVFTAALLEALSGGADTDKDGAITSAELFRSVQDHVEKWCIKSGKTQTPQMHPADGGKVVVARVVKGAPFVVPGGKGQSPGNLTLDIGGGVTMKLVLIPAGEFMMGSPAGEADRYDDEGPQHRVRITRAFYMGACEVTQEQYEAVMGTNPSNFKGAKNPVDQVSWNDATEFCRKLSAKTGMTVRLPTEAEWEYACRAGATTAYCFGDGANQLGDYAWHSANSGNQTHPAGQKKPNAWGLYDMHGNVWEWCADWFGNYPTGAVDDPTGQTTGEYRVLRGGSWPYAPRVCRSAIRGGDLPASGDSYFGFRVVASPRP